MSIMYYLLIAAFAKYGHLGVQLFFIIGGFIILKVAAIGSLRYFFISRIVCLYSAFRVYYAVTFLMTTLVRIPRCLIANI